jgi:hypothetical protein
MSLEMSPGDRTFEADDYRSAYADPFTGTRWRLSVGKITSTVAPTAIGLLRCFGCKEAGRRSIEIDAGSHERLVWGAILCLGTCGPWGTHSRL